MIATPKSVVFSTHLCPREKKSVILFEEVACALEKLEELVDWNTLDKSIWVSLNC